MSHSTKRTFSTIAIVIASVSFGVLISADLGLMETSNAQTTASIQTSQGPVTSVSIPSFADVAARVAPAVVSITTTEIVRQSDQQRRQFGGVDPFDFFFPDPRDPHRQRRNDDDERPQRSGGSGFIISADGYILTNNHVVEGATRVDVHFGEDENGNGGRTVTAKIIGRDPATDIALIKIEGTALPTVPLGDSNRIRKGDWAIAVGNPYSLENTLTVGVISAKGRSLGFSEETRSFENFIQTDAAINFGNSGGPLMNISGEVIGINTAIRGGAQGLGFATPINTAKTLLPQLRQGKVTRGYLGMTIQEITEDIREGFDLGANVRGALVQAVEPGKPAERAGIQHGDVIVEIDGRKINNNRELIDYISYLPVGTNVKVTVIRNNGRQTLTAKTAERPTGTTAENDDDDAAPAEPVRNKLGMSVQELTPQMRQTYGINSSANGVLVTDVKAVSAAAEANINEGDVISEVQGQRVTSVEQFRSAIEGARSGSRIRLYVTTPTRGGGTPFSSYRIVRVP
jgi:serine protease Do